MVSSSTCGDVQSSQMHTVSPLVVGFFAVYFRVLKSGVCGYVLRCLYAEERYITALAFLEAGCGEIERKLFVGGLVLL